MKFEVGKFYKTRDGRKAQIFILDNGAGKMLGAIYDGEWMAMSWNLSGKAWSGINEKNIADLVGEWVEPKEKVVMTEFLCWHEYDIFPQSRWAKSKEDAEKFCSDSNYKLLQWGLRTVEVEGDD